VPPTGNGPSTSECISAATGQIRSSTHLLISSQLGEAQVVSLILDVLASGSAAPAERRRSDDHHGE
jgi:hypothetical protein